MSNIFEKSIAFGWGLYTMSREKGEEIIEKMIEEGETAREEASGALNDLMKRADKEKKALEQSIEKSIEKSVERINEPVKKEIALLNKKVDQVLKHLEKTDKSDSQ